jgi:hypothetical protein
VNLADEPLLNTDVPFTLQAWVKVGERFRGGSILRKRVSATAGELCCWGYADAGSKIGPLMCLSPAQVWKAATSKAEPRRTQECPLMCLSPAQVWKAATSKAEPRRTQECPLMWLQRVRPALYP